MISFIIDYNDRTLSLCISFLFFAADVVMYAVALYGLCCWIATASRRLFPCPHKTPFFSFCFSTPSISLISFLILTFPFVFNLGGQQEKKKKEKTEYILHLSAPDSMAE
jgi:hypothetical protein